MAHRGWVLLLCSQIWRRSSSSSSHKLKTWIFTSQPQPREKGGARSTLQRGREVGKPRTCRLSGGGAEEANLGALIGGGSVGAGRWSQGAPDHLLSRTPIRSLG